MHCSLGQGWISSIFEVGSRRPIPIPLSSHTKELSLFYRLPFTQRDDIFSKGTVLFFLPVF